MSKVLENIKKQASLLGKHIVLPEGEDARVIKAASEAVKEGIAKVTVLGNATEIANANPDIDLTGVNIVDPKADANADQKRSFRAGFARCFLFLFAH